MKRLGVICLAVILIVTCCVLPAFAASSTKAAIKSDGNAEAEFECQHFRYECPFCGYEFWSSVNNGNVACPRCHRGFGIMQGKVQPAMR